MNPSWGPQGWKSRGIPVGVWPQDTHPMRMAHGWALPSLIPGGHHKVSETFLLVVFGPGSILVWVRFGFGSAQAGYGLF